MLHTEDGTSIDFSCGVADLVCTTSESLAGLMTDAITSLADFALDSSDFNSSSGLWAASIAQAGTWLGYTAIVMVITVAVSLAWGLVTSQPHAIRRAILGSLLAFPATVFAIFIVGRGLDVIDQISAGLLDSFIGGGGLASRVNELVSVSQGSVEVRHEYAGQTTVNDVLILADCVDGDLMNNVGAFCSLNTLGGGFGDMTGQQIKDTYLVYGNEGTSTGLLMLFLFIMLLGMLMLAMSFGFRTFVLMLLTAFAPIAFVLLPARGGEVWVKRWASAVVAMALAKPLMIGALALLFAAFGSVPSIGDVTVVPLLIGIVLIGLMPVAAYALFSFIGGGDGGDQVGTRIGGSAMQQAKSTGRGTNQSISRFIQGSIGRGSGSPTVAPTSAAPPPGRASRPPAAGGSGTATQGPSTTRGAGGGIPGGGSRAQPPAQPPQRPQTPPPSAAGGSSPGGGGTP